MSECAVYRMYDNADDLLYVGMSINVPQRLAGHKNKEWWPEVVRIDVEHCPGRKMAASVEAWAIENENPRYNLDPGGRVAADTVAELRRERPERPWLNRYGLMRYERGLTVDRVALESGVERKSIIRLEGGQTRRPSAHIVKALADFYGMSVAEFLGVEEQAA